MAESIDQYLSAENGALGRLMLLSASCLRGSMTTPSTGADLRAGSPSRETKLSLGNDVKFGQGQRAVDSLVEQSAVHDRSLWPRDGLSIHSANPTSRDEMAQAIRTQATRFAAVEESTPGGQPHFDFNERGTYE